MNSTSVVNLGRTKYADAWELQKKFWELRHTGAVGDLLILTEHEHVYTVGKGGDDNHLLASLDELKIDGTDVFRIDRGGDITYHGPGQIVCYPILDLNNYTPDIHLYLRNLEEVMIQTLAPYGIEAHREPEFTGVWVGNEKIGALGVKVSKWITMHGLALNVNTNLAKFDRIIPCGIFHKGVTSMRKILGRDIDLFEVESRLVDSFECVFGSTGVPLTREAYDAMWTESKEAEQE